MDLANRITIFKGERGKEEWKLRWLLHSKRKGKPFPCGVEAEPDPMWARNAFIFLWEKKEHARARTHNTHTHQLYPDTVKDGLWEPSSITGHFYKGTETQTTDWLG